MLLLLLLCAPAARIHATTTLYLPEQLAVVDSDSIALRAKVLIRHVIERDMPDLIRSLAGRKTILKNDSLLALARHRPQYTLAPAVGYTLSTGFSVLLAANISFYLSRLEGARQSTLQLSGTYTQYRQLILPVVCSIWSRDNKYNFLGDWRYYKYPQDTYGLGGYTTPDEANKIDYSYLRFYQSVLRKVHTNLTVGGGYSLDRHWNITQQPPYGNRTLDPTRYGLGKTSTSSGLSAQVQYDSRKNAFNPVPGSGFINVAYRDNLTILGSDKDWRSLIVDMRTYIGLWKRRPHLLALWSYTSITVSGTPPYLDLPSTGWDNNNNTGRGYIQSRFRGKNMLYAEAEYRFGISRDGLLGGVLFANAESFSEWPSNRFERVAPGAGGGLRLKLNKFSNTNIAIDYGFGLNGSRGLFVNLGELF